MIVVVAITTSSRPSVLQSEQYASTRTPGASPSSIALHALSFFLDPKTQ